MFSARVLHCAVLYGIVRLRAVLCGIARYCVALLRGIVRHCATFYSTAVSGACQRGYAVTRRWQVLSVAVLASQLMFGFDANAVSWC